MTTSTDILVVDDDPKIRAVLRRCLEGEGFGVVEADCQCAALKSLDARDIALVTLDISLGADSGLEVARTIRQTSSVPIIMVSGKDDVIDRVVGLEIGADDYITKPFHVREVVARVRSVLRRAEAKAAETATDTTGDGAAAGQTIRFDGLTVRTDLFELFDRSGRPAELTSGDFKLLAAFLEHPKRVLSRERIMDLVSGAEWTPLDRTIDNQVARLRKKIERDPASPRLIKTVRGIGYSFVADLEHV